MITITVIDGDDTEIEFPGHVGDYPHLYGEHLSWFMAGQVTPNVVHSGVESPESLVTFRFENPVTVASYHEQLAKMKKLTTNGKKLKLEDDYLGISFEFVILRWQQASKKVLPTESNQEIRYDLKFSCTLKCLSDWTPIDLNKGQEEQA